MLIASTPFYIWVPKSYEEAVATYFGKLRGVSIIRSSHQQLVFSQAMHFSDDDFLSMIKELEIEEVIVKCYGEKAGLSWGMKVAQLCREGDPNCEISFDCAISLPPNIMHWGKSEHMVPTLPDNDSFVTLARLTNRTKLQHEFGGTPRNVSHFPKLITPQMEWQMDDTLIHQSVPCFGDVMIDYSRANSTKHPRCTKVKIYNTIHHQILQHKTENFNKGLAGKTSTVAQYKRRLEGLMGPKYFGLLP